MNKQLKPQLLFTCEHGGNQIPPEYRYLFESPEARLVLETHRGWDPGTLEFGRSCHESFGTPLYHSETTRRLVDLNRALTRRTLFSEFTRELPHSEKEKILSEYYFPHRNQISAQVGEWLEAGESIIHIACHSFTPELHGRVRNTEIGLLYDPSWTSEAKLCRFWKTLIQERDPNLRVRFNYPYLGKNDGLTTHLRRMYRNQSYVGIELEINQKFPLADDLAEWKSLQRKLIDSLKIASSKPIFLKNEPNLLPEPQRG